MEPIVAKYLVKEAQSGAPKEICGFILDEGATYVPVDNVAPDPERDFIMDSEQMLSVILAHESDIVGMYHSHPSGANYPSDGDLPIMKHYHWMRFWIVTFQDVYEWKNVNGFARSCRRDGSLGTAGLVYPVLAPAEALRREGELPA